MQGGGGAAHAPDADIIVTSNVLEHLEDYLEVARTLLARCGRLFIAMPYREQPMDREHVRSCDEVCLAPGSIAVQVAGMAQ